MHTRYSQLCAEIVIKFNRKLLSKLKTKTQFLKSNGRKLGTSLLDESFNRPIIL